LKTNLGHQYHVKVFSFFLCFHHQSLELLVPFNLGLDKFFLKILEARLRYMCYLLLNDILLLVSDTKFGILSNFCTNKAYFYFVKSVYFKWLSLADSSIFSLMTVVVIFFSCLIDWRAECYFHDDTTLTLTLTHDVAIKSCYSHHGRLNPKHMFYCSCSIV